MIQKNYNRQAVTAALVNFALADVADGVAQAAVKLPGGAIVVGGFLVVDEAFNAETTATAKVGDSSTTTATAPVRWTWRPSA